MWWLIFGIIIGLNFRLIAEAVYRAFFKEPPPPQLPPAKIIRIDSARRINRRPLKRKSEKKEQE